MPARHESSTSAIQAVMSVDTSRWLVAAHTHTKKYIKATSSDISYTRRSPARLSSLRIARLIHLTNTIDLLLLLDAFGPAKSASVAKPVSKHNRVSGALSESGTKRTHVFGPSSPRLHSGLLCVPHSWQYIPATCSTAFFFFFLRVADACCTVNKSTHREIDL